MIKLCNAAKPHGRSFRLVLRMTPAPHDSIHFAVIPSGSPSHLTNVNMSAVIAGQAVTWKSKLRSAMNNHIIQLRKLLDMSEEHGTRSVAAQQIIECVRPLEVTDRRKSTYRTLTNYVFAWSTGNRPLHDITISDTAGELVDVCIELYVEFEEAFFDNETFFDVVRYVRQPAQSERVLQTATRKLNRLETRVSTNGEIAAYQNLTGLLEEITWEHGSNRMRFYGETIEECEQMAVAALIRDKIFANPETPPEPLDPEWLNAMAKGGAELTVRTLFESDEPLSYWSLPPEIAKIMESKIEQLKSEMLRWGNERYVVFQGLIDDQGAAPTWMDSLIWARSQDPFLDRWITRLPAVCAIQAVREYPDKCVDLGIGEYTDDDSDAVLQTAVNLSNDYQLGHQEDLFAIAREIIGS